MWKLRKVTNKIFCSNTYVIHHLQDAYMIDVGDIEPIMNTALDIKGVFITHGHHDHLYGINDLIQKFPSCTIYTSRTGVDALRSGKRNFSTYSKEGTIEYQGGNIKVLKTGDCIELFPNCFIKTYETPGHDDNCLTYMLDGYLFTGDSYIPGTKVVTKLPRGNKEQALQSLELIRSLCNKDTIICPGHGDTVPAMDMNITV